jgi:hypothetical protein
LNKGKGVNAMSTSTQIFLLFSILIGGIVLAILYLGPLPGQIAHRRKHPSAEAIWVCGWFGLIFLPLWLVAYIWAHSVPAQGAARDSTSSPAKTALACDGCGRPLAIVHATRIGTRLFCLRCEQALAARDKSEEPL